MFEREVMISSLKRQNEDLKKLIGEMEQRPRQDWQDSSYYHESLRRIENALKRLRRVDEEDSSLAMMGAKMKYYASPVYLRDMS